MLSLSHMWNGFLLLTQGAMQLSFLQRSTGKPLRDWLGITYLCLLGLGCYMASAFRCAALATVTQYVALYGLSRYLLASPPPPSRPPHPPTPVSPISGASGVSGVSGCALATLTVFVAQWSFGILNPLLALLCPYVVGSRLLYGLVGITALSALGCCYGCFHLLAPSDTLNPFTVPIGSARQADWPLLLSVLFISATERYLLATTYGNTVWFPAPIERGKHLILLFLQLLGGGTLFALFYSSRYNHHNHPYVAQKQESPVITDATVSALRQTIRLQAEYVTETQRRYHQTRALRHDIQNHLTVLEGLLHQGRLDQARAYLHQLTAVANEMSASVYTDNPVVDVLLRQKITRFAEKGIAVTITPFSLPRPCAVDDVSLCILFANALDNAWQECCTLCRTQTDSNFRAEPQVNRSIPASPSASTSSSCTSSIASPFLSPPPSVPVIFQIRSTQQGAFLLLEFINSCRDREPVSPGTGLANIQAVAEQYGGEMTIEKTNGLFALRVLLRCS